MFPVDGGSCGERHTADIGRAGLISWYVDGQLLGPLVVVHDLSHAGGHATSETVLVGAGMYGTQQVVGFTLSPLRFQHRGDGTTRYGHLYGRSLGMLFEPVNLFGIAIEPHLDVLGQVVEVQCSVSTISQHGLCPVGSRSNDKALLWCGEYIVKCVSIGLCPPPDGSLQRSIFQHVVTAGFGGQELAGTLECLLTGDTLGFDRHGKGQRQN